MGSAVLNAKESRDRALDALSHTDSWGWDQFGSMRGEVFIGTDRTVPEQFEVSLPGFKQRRWGLHETGKVERVVQLIGVCQDGTVFNIGAFDYGKGLAK